MAHLITVHGDWDAGKTTTCLRLSKYFGYDRKIATMTFEKGINDIALYYAEKNYHYCLPLEVVKGIEVLEKWVPIGYDMYILEGKNPDAGYISQLQYSIFPEALQNICIPRQFWDGLSHYEGSAPIITMCRPDQVPIEHPAVDWFQTLHGPEEMKQITFEPKLILPRDKTKILAFGYFPGEWFDMYPNLVWCQNDTAQFYKRIGRAHYDLILLGWTNDPEESVRLLEEVGDQYLISYDPRLFRERLTTYGWEVPGIDILDEARNIILNDPVGSPLPNEGYLRKYQNDYWVQMFFQELPLITTENNRMIINGWVHPLYLSRDNLIPGRTPSQIVVKTDYSQQSPRTEPIRRRR